MTFQRFIKPILVVFLLWLQTESTSLLASRVLLARLATSTAAVIEWLSRWGSEIVQTEKMHRGDQFNSCW